MACANLKGSKIQQTHFSKSKFLKKQRFFFKNSIYESVFVVNHWDIETNKKSKKKGHENVIRFVIFSPDSKRIISGSVDKTRRILDIEKQQKIGEKLLGHKDIVYCLVISSNALNLI